VIRDCSGAVLLAMRAAVVRSPGWTDMARTNDVVAVMRGGDVHCISAGGRPCFVDRQACIVIGGAGACTWRRSFVLIVLASFARRAHVTAVYGQ